MNIPSASTTCPHAEQLRAYCAAALPTLQMDAVEDHVSVCASCLHALDVFDEESDTLVQVLSTLPSNNDDEPALVHAREGLLSESLPISSGDCPTITIGPATSRAADFPDRVGDYELIELIGRGASGAVFRARHQKLDRVVAVKILGARYVTGDDQAIVRFQQEMRAVGRLNHPHIIQATDAGDDQGRHYLVMEYVEGVDVSRLLRFTGPLRVADACEIVRQAAQALQFAHDHKLVHRDVKPSNLLFSRKGEIKLLDLGLASIDDDEQTADESGIPFGTGDYMSPEQWTNFAGVDARADVYSLGCSLYKLLTGEPVFPVDRRSHGQKMEAHLRTPIPPVRALRPEVPLGLQKIISKMLAKLPEERIQTAAEVDAHLATYAVDARLESLGDRLSAIPREPLHAPLNDTAAIASASRQTTRRRVLIGAALAVPIAAAGLLLSRRRKLARLQTDVWRRLHPTSAPRSFPTAGSSDAAALLTAASDAITLESQHATTVDLGKPVSGRFRLSSTIRCDVTPQRVGLFFRYRPRKTKTSRVHPFQVIEIAHDGRELQGLHWVQYRFFEDRDGTFEVDRKPWAATSVTGALDQEHLLQVTLGLTGFPQVKWNDEGLPPSAWNIEWDGMHASRLTRRQLSSAYLGRLGIYVERGSASFSRTQLAYLE